MKRVIMIHGWGGSPKGGWFDWLKKELEKRNFQVIIPAMPDTENPKINAWVSKLNEIVGKPDKDTYLIGHSIGCQTIMRYLETLENKKVGGVIFVAGWFNLINLETDEEKEIAKPWLEGKIKTQKIKQITNKIVAIFSDDDPVVPLNDSKIFKEKLGAKVIIEKGKGHYEVDEAPVVLKEILEMAR